MIPQKPSATSRERMGLSVLGVTKTEPAILRTDAPALVMPLETSVVRALRRDAELTLDRSTCLVLPRGARVSLRASSASGRVAVLTVHDALADAVARAYRKLGVDRRRLDRALERFEVLPRTVWVHEIVHRYVFERYALGERDNPATRFLETEILKEVYFLFRDRDEGADRATIVRTFSASVERSLAYLEAHLFEPCKVAELVAYARASESTLLRSFHRELGCSPGAYWRSRKLDEALVFLRAGRDSVAEVAARVGYDNATAFAYAFRRRFGRPPSSFRPQRPLRPAP